MKSSALNIMTMIDLTHTLKNSYLPQPIIDAMWVAAVARNARRLRMLHVMNRAWALHDECLQLIPGPLANV